MAAISNPNILTPPEVADGFRTIQLENADTMLQDIESRPNAYRDYDVYAEYLVGSAVLKTYYERVVDTYNAWGRLALQTEIPQPIAIAHSNHEAVQMVFGHISRPIGEGVNPQPAHMKASHDFINTYDFGLWGRMGNVPVLATYDGHNVQFEQPNDNEKVQSVLLEQTSWTRNEVTQRVTVGRHVTHNIIAFGMAAIQSLPEFNAFALPFESAQAASLRFERDKKQVPSQS